MALTPDLRGAASEPVTMFTAKMTAWARPVPFAKAEFGLDEMYFSDGPYLLAPGDGRLHMIFSSWSEAGYAVGLAVSENGSVAGPWTLLEAPLYPANGGHGMLFYDKAGRLIFTLHAPNDKYAERPVFYPVELREGRLQLVSTD